jgi:hypothetical protein
MTPALLVRFPKLRAPTESTPVLPEAERAAFPDLRDDFTVLDADVAPAFERYDLQALRDQNRHRQQQVVLLLGAAVVSGLGGLQAVFPGQRWPGILLSVLGLGLSLFGLWAKRQAPLNGYLTARLQAERLRALHFLYLSRTGRYADADREQALHEAAQAIEAGRETK